MAQSYPDCQVRECPEIFWAALDARVLCQKEELKLDIIFLVRISKSLQERIDKVVKEKIDIVPYNAEWIKVFGEESEFLKSTFPTIIKRIEHFGSTAVPGLSAKPVVDMLIEITSYKEVKGTKETEHTISIWSRQTQSFGTDCILGII